MTPSSSPSALTDAQKIERLAEFMGWERTNEYRKPRLEKWISESGQTEIRENWDAKQYHVCIKHPNGDGYTPEELILEWNPLTDWNHWRQVEEKVMDNGELMAHFTFSFDSVKDHTELTPEDVAAQWFRYLHADLPTRVDALLSALDSLPSHE